MLLANSHRFVIYPSAEELVWGTVARVFMLALVVVAFIAARDMDRQPVRARISAKG